MGLIARAAEAQGIATLSLSSARSITAAANPPRAVYLDYPLGHTAGRADDLENQQAVLRDALRALEDIQTPGTIVDLPYHWSASDDWKDGVMRPKSSSASELSETDHEDDRIERHETPQYQHAADENQLEEGCPTCVFLEA